MPNPGFPALGGRRGGSGFVPGRLLDELGRPTRRVPAVPRQSGSKTRGVMVPAGELLARRPLRVGGLDERGEPLREFTQCVAAPLELRQVREPADVVGEDPANRNRLGVGHSHREELPHELRLVPEIQEILDAALASVEVDLIGQQLRVDFLLGEPALPVLVFGEVLEVPGVSGAHLMKPAHHVAMSVQPAQLVEALQARRRDALQGEAPRGSKREEVPVELPLPTLAARHDDLAGDEAQRLQEALLTAGEVPLDHDEGGYVSEVVAEFLVRADQRLQEPLLVGVEAAQHERQKGRLAPGVLQAVHGVHGASGPGIAKVDRGARVERLAPAAIGKVDARDVPHYRPSPSTNPGRAAAQRLNSSLAASSRTCNR